jgi:hypothetical protein
MMIVKANAASEAGVMPTAEELTEMNAYNEELVKAGVLLAAEGLHPSSKGTRIRFVDGKKTIIDGPFAETKELIAGFWLIQVKSREEALAWFKRVPNPSFKDDGEIELRQVFSAEDFGALQDQVPEVFEAERKFREGEEARARQHQQSSSAR